MDAFSPTDPAVVQERAHELRALIDHHATRPVRIVAVTKRFGPDAVAAALGAGISDIGENYAQELAVKAAAMAASTDRADEHSAPTWHFIGHVQRNKVRLVADVVHLWHTVDSIRLGREIGKRAPGARVLVQVNASGADNQSGAAPADVSTIVDGLRALELDVAGLMTIGALGDPERTRNAFRAVRRMADDLELPECSMGMSGDLEAALEAGSTLVRVGTALFGPRPA